MDHGYPVDTGTRCSATTQKQRQCSLPAIAGINQCALHAGLARARGKAGYGDPRALEAHKRRLLTGAAAASTRRR